MLIKGELVVLLFVFLLLCVCLCLIVFKFLFLFVLWIGLLFLIGKVTASQHKTPR